MPRGLHSLRLTQLDDTVYMFGEAAVHSEAIWGSIKTSSTVFELQK